MTAASASHSCPLPPLPLLQLLLQTLASQLQVPVPAFFILQLQRQTLNKELRFLIEATLGELISELDVFSFRSFQSRSEQIDPLVGTDEVLGWFRLGVDKLVEFPLHEIDGCFRRPPASLLKFGYFILEVYDKGFHVQVGPFFILSIKVDFVDQRHQFIRQFDVDVPQQVLDLGQSVVSALLVGKHLPTIGLRSKAPFVLLHITHLELWYQNTGGSIYSKGSKQLLRIYSMSMSESFDVWIVGQVSARQERRQKCIGLFSLVMGHHVARSLHRGKGEPSEFPDHAAHLVLVFVQAGHPPLSPLFLDGNPLVISEPGNPGQGAGDGDAVVNVSAGDPHSQSLVDQNGVEPVAGVFEHLVIFANFIGAGFKALRFDVEVGLDGGGIEEFIDSIHVLADDSVSHVGRAHSVWQFDSLASDPGHLLVGTLGIQIQHAGVGCVKLLIGYLSLFGALATAVSQPAGPFEHGELLFGVETVEIQILVLVYSDVDVVAGLVALPGVSAGVVDHHPHQPHLLVRGSHPIRRKYLVCQVGHVDACIALSCQKQVVLLQVRELLEKGQQSLVVVFRGCAVVGFRTALRFAEPDSSR